MNLETAGAGLKMAHLSKIAGALDFSVLTLTVSGVKPPKELEILFAFEHQHHFNRP